MIARACAPALLFVATSALALVAGCGHPTAVVSAGASTPVEQRTEDPFARLEDRSPVTAYEFGSCTTDAQCAPASCGGAMCAPIWESDGLCQTSRVQACLAAVPDDQCGCVDGFCRWARTAPVMQCGQGDDRAGTRGFRGGPPNELYPLRVGD